MTKKIEVPVTFVSSPIKAEEVQIYHRLREVTGDCSDFPVFRMKQEVFDWNISLRKGVGNLLVGIFEASSDNERFLVPPKTVATAMKTFFHQHPEQKKWKHAFVIGAPYETSQTKLFLEIFADPRLMFIAPSPNGAVKRLEQSITDAASWFNENRGWAFKEISHDAEMLKKIGQLIRLADIDPVIRDELLDQNARTTPNRVHASMPLPHYAATVGSREFRSLRKSQAPPTLQP